MPWLALRGRSDGCADPVRELLAQFRRRIPRDVIVLPRVEVRALNLVSSARVDHRSPQSKPKSRLEVDSRAVQSEVGDDETRAAQFGDNAIVDLVVVLSSVNAHRLISAVRFDRGEDAFVV